MADMKGAVQQIYSLEQLAGRRTAVHALHPTAKLLCALGYLVLVVSFGRYDFGRLLPFLFYPFVLMALAEIPYAAIGKRFLVALPFCAMAGLSNLLLDRGTALTLGALRVSWGALSCATILLKTYLCVSAVLILIATTAFSGVTASMRALHVPQIFVTLFELVYRYIGTLIGEASSMHLAYLLRSPGKKGVEMKHMGSFVGQLLLRSFDRSERVYEAMKCRGYGSPAALRLRRPFAAGDWALLAAVLLPGLLLRVFDVPALLGAL